MYTYKLTFAFVLLTIALAGCSDSNTNTNTDTTPVDSSTLEGDDVPTDHWQDADLALQINAGSSVFTPDPNDIQSFPEHYQRDGYADVNVIRLDVKTNTTPGTCTVSDISGCTLEDVIADIDGNDEFKVDILVHLKGDDLPDDGSVSNAEMRQRGESTRLAPQKSFRIKLDSKEMLWRNERRLQLNKHPYDEQRIRNKLSFDLMSQIPNLRSMRSQFVNLWVDNGQGPEDYGLFTHIESSVKEYFVNRGLNTDDTLYKPEYLPFLANDVPRFEVDADGVPLDIDAFEKRLEIENGDDHRKLYEMMVALSDPEQSFEAVFDRYFNRSNVVTWVTVNLLLRNFDTITHNFYLYNPVGSEKFFILPWDYDNAFSIYEARVPANNYDTSELEVRRRFGYARGIESDFFSRFYQLPGIHDEILAAATELRSNHLSASRINELAIQYQAVVQPFVTALPDIKYNESYRPTGPNFFAAIVAANEESMRFAFSYPMPHTQNDPVVNGSQVIFSWTPAFDVTGHTIDYDLQVSTDLAFASDSIVFSEQDIPDSPDSVNFNVDLSALPAGQLYYRVTARVSKDPDLFWQIAENTLEVGDTIYYGIVGFEVP